MLDRRNNTLLLNSLDSFTSTNGLKDGIGTETLPISTTFRLAAHGSYGGCKPDVDSLATSFFANGYRTLVHELLVECCADCDAIWEDGDIVGLTNTVCRVVEAELGEANSLG
jgi:hypothetical protein